MKVVNFILEIHEAIKVNAGISLKAEIAKIEIKLILS